MDTALVHVVYRVSASTAHANHFYYSVRVALYLKIQYLVIHRFHDFNYSSSSENMLPKKSSTFEKNPPPSFVFLCFFVFVLSFFFSFDRPEREAVAACSSLSISSCSFRLTTCNSQFS